MQNITIIIKNDEEILSSLIELLNNLKNIFNTLLENVQINNSHIINELFKNCAGYILTEYVILFIKNITDEKIKKHFTFDENKWYDFKYDNYPIKIITFESGDAYSFTKLTETQYNHRKDFIYVSLVYSIEGNSLTITEQLITTSDNVRIKYDKVLYNSVCIPNEIPDNKPKEEDNTYNPWEVYSDNNN